MPVMTFALLLCAVILAAGLTVFVAVQLSATLAAGAGGLVALGLLLAAILLRRAGR